MPRHAGFGVVVSARQSAINQNLRSRTADIGPFFFPLPQTITVAGTAVTFGGLLQMAAPTVELHDNAQGLITAHFAFFSTFSAQPAGGVLRRWRVRLDAAVSASIAIAPVNNQLVASLNTGSVTFQPLAVTVLQGPPPPSAVLSALQSPALANAATAFVRGLPSLTLTSLMANSITHTQPATFKDSGFSVFDWFTISLTVSRVVVRIHEGAVTVAADFAGITSGNPAELVDLTRTHGGGAVYVQTVTTQTNPKATPIPVGKGYSAGSDLALAFNIGVLSHIVARQISPRIAGTPISKQAVLNSISARFSRFEKPLRGYEGGLHFHIEATAKGIDGEVDVYVQPFLRTYDGPTNFIRSDTWQLFVARVDVDLPWWVDLLIGVAQVLTVAVGVVVTIPALINVTGLLPWLNGLFNGLNDSFAQADPQNIAAATQLTVQNAAYDAALPAARYISVNADSIDLGFGGGHDIGSALPVEPDGGAIISPERWSAIDTEPIVTTVALTPNWRKLNRDSLRATWEVRRRDTNAVVVTGTRPYNDSPWQLRPGNGVAVDHHSKELYLVEDFVIRCTLTMTLGSQAGEIWTGERIVHIDDLIDRSHPFVEWGPKHVYFSNAGTEGKYWVRLSRSRIHRTAVAARCRMLRIGAEMRKPAMEREAAGGRYVSRYASFRYRDDLPFSWNHLNAHRTELCEYCFFGGPEKMTALPREDWFSRP